MAMLRVKICGITNAADGLGTFGPKSAVAAGISCTNTGTPISCADFKIPRCSRAFFARYAPIA